MRRTTDRRKKKIAPVVVAVLVILYVLPLCAFVLMAAGPAGREDVRLLLPLLSYALLGGAVIVGILKALHQRLEEIDGGEEDEASQY